MHAPKILLALPDLDLAETVRALLEDDGCTVVEHDDLDGEVDATECALALVDSVLVGRRATPSRTLAQVLGTRPVGVLATRPLDAPKVRGSFVLQKPFEADALLARVAEALRLPPTDAQRAQIAHVEAYFRALEQHAWDALGGLVHEHVCYRLRSGSHVRGRAAFQAHAVAIFGDYDDVRFERLAVHPLPRVLHARWLGTWKGRDGRPHQAEGAARFDFEGEVIRAVGVDIDADRLRTLGHRV